MPRGTKRLASSEKTTITPKAKERVQFSRRSKSRSHIYHLRQQTLTQIDFVSYIPTEDVDLNPIDDEEPLGYNIEENSAKVEQADVKTTAKMAPSVVPSTPRKKHKLEIPSSHSPPDSPYSPNNTENPRRSVSPLAAKAKQLLPKSTPRLETTLGARLLPTLMLGSNVPWESGENLPPPLPPLSGSRGISSDARAEGSIAIRHPTVGVAAFEEESGGAIASHMGSNSKPLGKTLGRSVGGTSAAVAKTEIRGSDEEDSESDYDFGPETQAMVDNMDFAFLSEPFSGDETSPPRCAQEVGVDVGFAPQPTTGRVDAGMTTSANSRTKKTKRVSFKEVTTAELCEVGSDTSLQTCGHSLTCVCETEDACIRLRTDTPKRDNGSSRSQYSALLSRKYTSAASEKTLHDTNVQPTSASPPAHIKSPTSRPTSLDVWIDDYTRAGRASRRIYEFESASQLLPESLMDNSLPLPPGFSQEAFDEDY
ncbi:MAG: hypothetical protein M1839_009310 [Geoglossum umbratile]|nr:MAG: hypothetical protein M1839_009310 [Geoglossum umbratile]